MHDSTTRTRHIVLSNPSKLPILVSSSSILAHFLPHFFCPRSDCPRCGVSLVHLQITTYSLLHIFRLRCSAAFSIPVSEVSCERAPLSPLFPLSIMKNFQEIIVCCTRSSTCPSKAGHCCSYRLTDNGESSLSLALYGGESVYTALYSPRHLY